MKMFSGPEKQLQCKRASRERLKLTGVIGEIVVVVVGRIIVWKQTLNLGHILLFIKEFRFYRSTNGDTHLSQGQYL